MVTKREDFRQFFEAQSGQLRQLAYRLTGNWAESEDLMQDAMVRTYHAWRRIQERDRPELYARAVLVNRHRSLLRRATMQAKKLAASRRSQMDIDPALQGATDMVAVSVALKQLPYRQRVAIVLQFYEDLPQSEIGAILHCPPSTVASLIHRGIARLREQLSPHPEELLAGGE